MYNIIEQHQNQSSGRNVSVMMMMMATNETKSSPVLTTTSGGFKIDCAKECPCGVPVIPVPDQWLEVMVTGGFKVWHIIFIIIAFLVTIVVVYCCFHRCRIPRTKQEIEADLMRTNLTTKFRDYLQEFPNEPTTFLEAIKKVKELEEKWASEQDDTGAKKRMGWLKLRKDRQPEKGADVGDTAIEIGSEQVAGVENVDAPVEPDETKAKSDQQLPTDKVEQAQEPKVEPTLDTTVVPVVKSHKTKSEKVERQTTKHKPDGEPDDRNQVTIPASDQQATNAAATAATSDPSQPSSRPPPKVRRKRNKPNLSRTKAAHVGAGGESIEANTNILTVPVTKPRQHGSGRERDKQLPNPKPEATTSHRGATKSSKSHSSRTTKLLFTEKDSTTIHINTDPSPSRR